MKNIEILWKRILFVIQKNRLCWESLVQHLLFSDAGYFLMILIFLSGESIFWTSSTFSSEFCSIELYELHYLSSFRHKNLTNVNFQICFLVCPKKERIIFSVRFRKVSHKIQPLVSVCEIFKPHHKGFSPGFWAF